MGGACQLTYPVIEHGFQMFWYDRLFAADFAVAGFLQAPKEVLQQYVVERWGGPLVEPVHGRDCAPYLHNPVPLQTCEGTEVDLDLGSVVHWQQVGMYLSNSADA
jgi:hypothetical protein